MKKIVFFFFFILLSGTSTAQRDVSINTEVWYGLMTSGQLAKNWSLWIDSHHVPELFLIVRGGLTYHSNNQQWSATMGYAGLGLTTPFSAGDLIRNERRPWGQVVFRPPGKGNLSASFRYRHDMRFRQQFSSTELLDSYQLNHRLRFNASVRYNWRDLISPHVNFSTTLFNESLFTVGPALADNPFEHRVFMLFSFQKKFVTVSPGYHIRVATPNPETLRINHGLFLWININYSLKEFRRSKIKVFPEDRI
ncbi:DUF2490 domain-containing protein [Mongoliitalea daihaiensis]|uniref:DUF2490 domain-containing protein n=1 Tax=Mongoliitalea daihaiensis TaxID=2782006 RepID=UPI001F40F076|nr:DUF2490 domain-containing protein [Mongoliitalea daihaiensis]UJP63912.1 DUF2490 domain-containing protein [Mongoliitalea daihaiensis]